MPRNKKNDTDEEVTIENKRKHEARMSKSISIPPLGKVTIPLKEWREIMAENKHVRKAVNKRFITITNKGK